jgi:hypothetical protein
MRRKEKIMALKTEPRIFKKVKFAEVRKQINELIVLIQEMLRKVLLTDLSSFLQGDMVENQNSVLEEDRILPMEKQINRTVFLGRSMG